MFAPIGEKIKHCVMHSKRYIKFLWTTLHFYLFHIIRHNEQPNAEFLVTHFPSIVFRK